MTPPVTTIQNILHAMVAAPTALIFAQIDVVIKFCQSHVSFIHAIRRGYMSKAFACNFKFQLDTKFLLTNAAFPLFIAIASNVSTGAIKVVYNKFKALRGKPTAAKSPAFIS